MDIRELAQIGFGGFSAMDSAISGGAMQEA